MKSKISVLVLVLLLMISCEEEFLTLVPQSSLTTELIFKTDDDFRNALNGTYSLFRSFYNRAWIFGDLPSDDCEFYALRSVDYVNIDNFNVDVNSSELSNAWRDLYRTIGSANLVLSRLETADPYTIIDKVQYEAEARFCRALAYFNLARIFGDLPMFTEPVVIEDALKTPRTDVAIIYDEIIISDFLAAEAMLPVSYPPSMVGLPTKGAAKSLLGKVYLTIHDYQKAESKLMEVTTMGYSLLEDWFDLFDWTKEHHSEYIFDIEYIGGGLGIGSNFPLTFSGEDQDIGSPWVSALREVFGYTGRRGGGTGGGCPSLDFFNSFDPDDIRKERTAVDGIYDLNGNWVVSTGPTPRLSLKYVQPGYNFSISNDGLPNWRVTRYADVILMLAEALNENGKTPEALVYLNQIRVRAGLEEYSALTQTEARDKILEERRWELYLEGHRWFDLVRTGRAMEFLGPLGMKSHMTVFPVPQSQIEVINDPSIFPQNDGY